MTVREKIDGLQGKGDGFQERVVRKTYEDPYTIEFLEFWRCVREKAVPKTSAEDARGDLNLFRMIMRAGYPVNE